MVLKITQTYTLRMYIQHTTQINKQSHVITPNQQLGNMLLTLENYQLPNLPSLLHQFLYVVCRSKAILGFFSQEHTAQQRILLIKDFMKTCKGVMHP